MANPAVTSEVRNFLSRGEAFFASMNQLSDETLFDAELLGVHRPSVALLAVHASIAFSDAARTYLAETSVSADDHRAAAKHLKRDCGRAGRDADGVEHLVWLVNRKHDFAYGSKTVRLSDTAKAQLKAQRFASWIFRTFPEFGGE